jgi:hypothetical protein
MVQIQSGAEGRPRARDDDDVQRFVIRRVVERVRQVVYQIRVKRIAFFRAVEREQ